MAIKAGAKNATIAAAQPPQVFYRINSLLYTLRAIAQREDQLCMLMHHLRTSGRLNASLAAELHEILDEIPSDEYLHDLDALRSSLDAAEGKPAAVTGSRNARSKAGTRKRAA